MNTGSFYSGILRAFYMIMKKCAAAFLVLFSVCTLSFFIHHLLPSDPARAIAGMQARKEDLDRIRIELGLNEPLYTQYIHYMSQLFHFTKEGAGEHLKCFQLGFFHIDFGQSYVENRAVIQILKERLPHTLFLGASAIFFQFFFGILLGILASIKQSKSFEISLNGLSLFFLSTPTFLLGLALQYLFAVKWKLLPIDGYGKTSVDHLLSVILPSLTLGLIGMWTQMRLTKQELSSEMKKNYFQTALAKGHSKTNAILLHAFRNAFFPLFTSFSLELGNLTSGAVITETVFRWPGMGELGMRALLNKDAPVMFAVVFLGTLFVVLANLLSETVQLLFDPTSRTQS